MSRSVGLVIVVYEAFSMLVIAAQNANPKLTQIVSSAVCGRGTPRPLTAMLARLTHPGEATAEAVLAGCYNRVVRAFVLAVIVGLLTLSASGVCSLVINEPCTRYELPGSDDGACPPTCVTCGCCAQAVEPVTIVGATPPDVRVADMASFLPDVLRTTAREILHVPKLPLF